MHLVLEYIYFQIFDDYIAKSVKKLEGSIIYTTILQIIIFSNSEIIVIIFNSVFIVIKVKTKFRTRFFNVIIFITFNSKNRINYVWTVSNKKRKLNCCIVIGDNTFTNLTSSSIAYLASLESMRLMLAIFEY